jgi:RNA polymerase sigma-70 factor (ECF subfamily)
VNAEERLDAAVEAARDGDEAAFAELFRALHPPLQRYLRARYGEGSEDVAAETWSAVARGIHRFHGAFSDFRAWTFTIARARAIDEMRRRAKRAIPVQDCPVEATHASAEAEALDNLEHQDLLALVRRLSPDQADAVAARVLAGLDVAATAELLGKSPTAVRINTHRGLRRLAAMIPQQREVAS